MFGEWESDIISYFQENQLDIEKVNAMRVVWGIDCLKIETESGIVVLRVCRDHDGKPIITQTEDTKLLKVA